MVAVGWYTWERLSTGRGVERRLERNLRRKGKTSIRRLFQAEETAAWNRPGNVWVGAAQASCPEAGFAGGDHSEEGVYFCIAAFAN